MTYKIGQICTFTEDVEMSRTSAFFNEKVLVPKGTAVIIGADKFAHHIQTGAIQPLGDSVDVAGYDAKGIAKYLARLLMARFPIAEMLEDYELSKKSFVEEIEFALDEIGF